MLRSARGAADPAATGRAAAHVDPGTAIPLPGIDLSVPSAVVPPHHIGSVAGRQAEHREGGCAAVAADPAARGRAAADLDPTAAIPAPDIDLPVSCEVHPRDVGDVVWADGDLGALGRRAVSADPAAAGRAAHLDPTAAVPAPDIDFVIAAAVVVPGDVGRAIGRDGQPGHSRVAHRDARPHLLPRAARPAFYQQLAAPGVVEPGHVGRVVRGDGDQLQSGTSRCCR